MSGGGKNQFIENSGKTQTYLTVQELADQIRVSPKTLYGWVSRGKIPYMKFGQRVLRFNKEKIDRWILQNQKENSYGY